MNILQILPSLDVGGVETGTVDLARYLVRHGHKAITVSGGGRMVKELDAIGARHYILPVGKKSILTVIRMIGKLSAIIRNEDIDIVHARSRVPAIIAYFACKRTNRAFITTAHGYYKKHLLSRAMGWGKFVIVASNIMAKHMTNSFGVPYERIRLIPRGSDLEKFKFRDPSGWKSKQFTIGMVSRITPLKGHADFIKAVSILARQIPELKVIIVGEAPKVKYREDVEILVRRLGLSGKVDFLGSRQDVPEILAGFDILVSATITPEAFGRVIIEAQASGVPVVATKVGGVVDIVEDEKTGLLCAAGDSRDMAEKILKLYNDREMWKKIALDARKSMEESFTAEKMMEKTVAVYEEALKSVNILVIKLSALGDVILSIPSLKAIRLKYPNGNIKVLVGLRSREVLDNCPYISDRIVCDFNRKHRGLFGLWALIKEVQKSSVDMVVDLQNNRKSHLIAFASLAPFRYGYDNGKWSFFLNKTIKDDAPYLDPLEHQFRTLRLAGIKPLDKRLELWPSGSDEKAVDRFLADNWVKPEQELVGIHIRASEKWVTKNWPASNIAQLCDRLAKEFNIRVVLTGSKSDADISGYIAKIAKSKPLIACGKTGIMELAALLKRFKVYLTPDSAPMHMASAVGTPVIALFGPTDPARHVVRTDRCIVICKANEAPCAPCYSPSCAKNFKCMKKITVEEVFEAMRPFLPIKKEDLR